MAVVPFGYQNMQNQLGVGIAQNTNQMYKDQIDQARKNNIEDYKMAQEQADKQSLASAFANNTNADGSIDQKGLVSQLGQVNPEAALKLQQSIGQQENNVRKTNADIMRAQAQANAQEAVAKSNNLKIAQSVITGLNNQLAQATPENWDATVSQAKKMAENYGVDLPDSFSEGYSDDKKSQAINAAMSLKDKIDADSKQHQQLLDDGRYNLDVFKANNQVQNNNAQTSIQQQNADTNALNAQTTQQNAQTNMQNANTNSQRLQNDQAKVQQQKSAVIQKQYQQDQTKFSQAKVQYQADVTAFNTYNRQISSVANTAQSIISQVNADPSLTGSISSKVSAGIANATGAANNTSDFRVALGQLASILNLSNMKQMKGFGALSDADMRMISAASGIDPSKVISPEKLKENLNIIVSNSQQAISDAQKEMQVKRNELQNLSTSLTQKYSNSGTQSNTTSLNSQPVQTQTQTQATIPVPTDDDGSDDDNDSSTMGSQLGM